MTTTLTLPAVAPPGHRSLASDLPVMGARAWTCCAVGAGAVALALLWFVPASDAGAAVPDTLADAPAVIEPRSVMSSGVVETIRELRAEGVGARRFEMTIRMRDGTRLVSVESGTATWRVGDQLSTISRVAGS